MAKSQKRVTSLRATNDVVGDSNDRRCRLSLSFIGVVVGAAAWPLKVERISITSNASTRTFSFFFKADIMK